MSPLQNKWDEAAPVTGLRQVQLENMQLASYSKYSHNLFCLSQEARSNWDFDMNRLDAATNGRSLSCFAFWLLQVVSRSLRADHQLRL